MPEMWQARFIDISLLEAKWMDNMTYDTKGPDARTGAILLKMFQDFVLCLLFFLFVFFSASYLSYSESRKMDSHVAG